MTERSSPMGARVKLHPTDLMNPKLYRSAEAMLRDGPLVHRHLTERYGTIVERKIRADIVTWYNVWLMLSVVRILRFQRKVDFRDFLRGVPMCLTRDSSRFTGSHNFASAYNYVATARPHVYRGYGVVFEPTDDLRVVSVEHVW